MVAGEDKVEIFALDGEKGVIPTGSILPVRNTSVGRAITEQKIIITADTRKSDYIDTRKLSEQGLLSTISAPLIIGDQVLGSLNIANFQTNAYDMQDQQLLQQLASLFASTLENRRLFEQTTQTLHQTQTLQRFSQTLAGLLDIEQVYTAFNQTCLEEVGFEYVQFSLVDHTQQAGQSCQWSKYYRGSDSPF